MPKDIKKTVWIYGQHAVKAAISNPTRKIVRIITANQKLADDLEIDAEIVGKQYFIDLFGREAIHQGVAVLTVPRTDFYIEDFLNADDNRPIVLLDQITDPHNIGAILRSAAVYDARCLVVTTNHSPAETAVLAKAASGALEIVPIIRVVNLVQCIKLLKKNGFWCIGLAEEGNSYLSNMDLSSKYAFIIGSEGSGMRRLTRESCDILAKLPSSAFSTLNAAQACTVALYESFVQRSGLIDRQTKRINK